MINIVSRPLASHPKPDDAVRAILLAIDDDDEAMAVVAGLDAPGALAVAPAALRLFPSQLASVRIVVEN